MQFFFFIFFLSLNVFAENDFSFKTELGFDYRIFPEKSTRYPNDQNSQFSGYLKPELELFPPDSKFEYKFSGFLRNDSSDDARDYFEIKELFVQYVDDNFDLTIGSIQNFWGVTESAHIVDIINQKDFREDLDGEEKLGQPSIRYRRYFDMDLFSFYIMPYFRERPSSTFNKRFSSALPVNSSSLFPGSASKNHIDFSTRFQKNLGNNDIGLIFFRGNSRDPIVTIENFNIVNTYKIINVLGLDYQYTSEDLLIKLETTNTNGFGKSYNSTVFGFEKLLPSIFSRIEVNTLLEFQFDDRNISEAPATSLDDDIFFGFRFNLNDVNDTQFLIGSNIDTNDTSSFSILEGSRRFLDSYKLSLTYRGFNNYNNDQPFYFLKNDDYINLNISKFF